MAKQRIVALVGVLAVAVAGLAGCGGSSSASSPGSIKSALQSTANQSGLKLTVSLTGSPSSSNGSMTRSQQQAIIDSTLTMSVHAKNGTTLANAGNGGEVALSLNHSGNTLAELREVGSTAYARVDIQQFTSTYSLDTGSVARFRSQLSQLGSQVAGLNALNNGQWVSLDVNLLNQFLQTTGITLPSVPQLVGRVVGAFFNNLAQNATISDVHNNQATLTVNERPLVTALADALSGTPGMSSFGKQISNLGQRANASVPANARAHGTVTVANGIVSNLELPLNQFQRSRTSNGPTSVKMAVETAGAVSAPSGATAISLPQLIRALESSSSSS